jgi:hypothetical protein
MISKDQPAHVEAALHGLIEEVRRVIVAELSRPTATSAEQTDRGKF